MVNRQSPMKPICFKISCFFGTWVLMKYEFYVAGGVLMSKTNFLEFFPSWEIIPVVVFDDT